MNLTNNQAFNTKLIKQIIRVPKEESAFFYFQLEANENIAFYSTLEESLKQGHRDIEVICSEDFSEEIDQIVKNLLKKCNGVSLSKEVINDE